MPFVVFFLHHKQVMKEDPAGHGGAHLLSQCPRGRGKV